MREGLGGVVCVWRWVREALTRGCVARGTSKPKDGALEVVSSPTYGVQAGGLEMGLLAPWALSLWRMLLVANSQTRPLGADLRRPGRCNLHLGQLLPCCHQLVCILGGDEGLADGTLASVIGWTLARGTNCIRLQPPGSIQWHILSHSPSHRCRHVTASR